MFQYTGHPLVDVGLATILAFSGKSDPADLTSSDLDHIADYISRQYSKNPMRSFLTVIFPNSGFTQPAFDRFPEKRDEYANRVLRGYKSGVKRLEDRCVFFGTSAVLRAMRETIPLIGSEGAFNFYPDGYSGLPVSAEALLCIQAFPLGGIKCTGRVLIVHAESSDLTLTVARRFLDLNRRYLGFVEQQDDIAKYADAKHPRTQLVTALLDADQERRDVSRPVSLTAYHLTNYGTNADITIYHLPMEIVDFLRSATSARYQGAWRAIERRGWEETGDERDAVGLPARRNFLYEDLFALPTESRRFLRTYLLRMPRRMSNNKYDPRQRYSPAQETGLIDWELTTLFLRKVMKLEKDRIETLRSVGERLAEYIYRENDRSLFNTLLRAQRYEHLRAGLIRASARAVRHAAPPLISFEEFVAIFEESDEVARLDWGLARDLLLIRVLDFLYRNQQDWLAGNREVLELASESENEPSFA